MKSVAISKEAKKKEDVFPRLMRGNNMLIVFATGPGDGSAKYPCFSGVVVSEGDEHSFGLGVYSGTWNKDVFTPFDGTIQLSNE